MRNTCYKVNTKYERSKLELSWINLGMRSHSHYELWDFVAKTKNTLAEPQPKFDLKLSFGQRGKKNE